MSDYDQSQLTQPEEQLKAGSRSSHDRVTSNLERNGLQLMHEQSVFEGVDPNSEVLNVRDLSADQRRKSKHDALEHGNSDYPSSGVGQASGSSATLSAAFTRIDDVKAISRCRTRTGASTVSPSKRRKLSSSVLFMMHGMPPISGRQLDYQAHRGNGLDVLHNGIFQNVFVALGSAPLSNYINTNRDIGHDANSILCTNLTASTEQVKCTARNRVVQSPDAPT